MTSENMTPMPDTQLESIEILHDDMYLTLSETSRERPKSAPYPRLKNSKRTSKFPSIDELGLLS